jgi:hypothetical protein
MIAGLLTDLDDWVRASSGRVENMDPECGSIFHIGAVDQGSERGKESGAWDVLFPPVS